MITNEQREAQALAVLRAALANYPDDGTGGPVSVARDEYRKACAWRNPFRGKVLRGNRWVAP